MNLQVNNIDASLLREVNLAAAQTEMTQRDFIVQALLDAVDMVANGKKSAREAQQ